MGRKDVGLNLGLKEMDPLYFYVLLSDEKNLETIEIPWEIRETSVRCSNKE